MLLKRAEMSSALVTCSGGHETAETSLPVGSGGKLRGSPRGGGGGGGGKMYLGRTHRSVCLG